MRHSRNTVLLALTGSSIAAPTSWHGQPRSSSIAWGPCDMEGFNASIATMPIQCAKITVPLDYTNPASEDLQIQLLKVNATKESRGSVLFNPGGPQATGTDDVATNAKIYSDILGGHYDLIGFDPRGTGRTIPFSCSLNWTEHWTTGNLQRRNDLIQTDLVAFFENQGWNDSTYVAQRCYEDNIEYGRFLSTAFVARDMLNIVDALKEDGMLRFFGGSYGTLLGQTFAAMFPERVDRMLLDSVVDGPDYMKGFWLPALKDTEKSLMGFFESCISAGPELCALVSNGSETTAPELLSAFNAGLQSLLDDPLPPGALAGSVRIPGPATDLYTAIKGYVFSTLYKAASYPELAVSMLSVITQNRTELELAAAPISEEALAEAESAPLPWNLGLPNAFWGIACSDASFRASVPEDMLDIVEAQQNVSGFSDAFIGSMWPCAQWKLEPAERFEGSFGNESHPIKTQFPLMFVNGEYDPATPHSSAVKAAKGFEGSRLLTHGGHGHKFWRHPSTCTSKAVEAYFVNGTLPKEGSRCEADVNAFEVMLTGGPGASSTPVQSAT